MTTGNNAAAGMSATREADSPVLACGIDHIPLFPLRYAFTGDALEKAKDGASCGVPPSSLSAVDNVTFELTRARGGYIFIYTESGLGVGADKRNIWHPFYHCTIPDDDNSAAPRIDTEKEHLGTPHHFYKYKWDNGEADGPWSIYTKEELTEKGEQQPQSYPYPFVALGTSKAWVAYSEERWPAHFFKKIQDDPAFRDKMMTKVEISEEPTAADRYAPLTDLPKLSRQFSGSEPETSFEFSNSIRHTVITPASWGSVATSACAQEYGYVVLVNDPVAMALDLGAMLILTQQSKSILSQKYLYPLVTGKIVSELEKNGSIRTNTWSLMLGETRPHIDDFKAHYDRLQEESQEALDEIHQVEKGVFDTWRSLMDQTGPGSITGMMQLYLAEFNAARKEDRPEIAGSALYDMSRAVQPFALCDNPQISPYFDGILTGQPSGGAGASAVTELIAKFGAAFAATLSTAQDRNFFYLLGWSAAVETFSARLNKRGKNFSFSGQKLIAMRKTLPLTFSTQEEAAAAIRQLYDTGRLKIPTGGGRSQLPRELHDLVETGTRAPRFPGDQPQHTYTIDGYRPIIAQEVPPDWLTRAERMSTNGMPVLSGLGMVATGFALSAAVGSWNQARTYRDVKDWLFDPSVVVVAAFSEFAMSIYAARESARAVAQSSQMFARIYGRLPSLAGTAVSQLRVVRGAGSFMRGAGGKALGPVLGVYMAAKDLNEGFGKDDRNLKIAGGLGIFSVAAFAFTGAVTGPPGWVALTLGALAAVGAAIYGFYKLNNYELWVRKGIWGGDRETSWWGRKRQRVTRRLPVAEALADPSADNHAFATEAYEKEMKEFFDVAGSLTIANKAEADGKIEILCPELNTAHDLTRLRLEVFMFLQTEVNGPVRQRNLTLSRDYTLRFDGPGRAAIQLNPASFPAFAKVDTVIPRLVVEAQFRRSNGKILKESESFRGKIESM